MYIRSERSIVNERERERDRDLAANDSENFPHGNRKNATNNELLEVQ